MQAEPLGIEINKKSRCALGTQRPILAGPYCSILESHHLTSY